MIMVVPTEHCRRGCAREQHVQRVEEMEQIVVAVCPRRKKGDQPGQKKADGRGCNTERQVSDKLAADVRQFCTHACLIRLRADAYDSCSPRIRHDSQA